MSRTYQNLAAFRRGCNVTWSTVTAADLGTPVDSAGVLTGAVTDSGSNLQIPVDATDLLRRYKTGAGIETLWFPLTRPAGVAPSADGVPTAMILWEIVPDSIPDTWGVAVGLADSTGLVGAAAGIVATSATQHRLYIHDYGSSHSEVGTAFNMSDNRRIICCSSLWGGDIGSSAPIRVNTSAQAVLETAGEFHLGYNELGTADVDDFVPAISILRTSSASDPRTLSVQIRQAVLTLPSS